MKKILYIISFFYLAISLAGCDHKIDFPFQGKDRIQFQHFKTDWNGNRIYRDSIDFSFGLLPLDITIDTVKIPVEFLGKPSEKERTYKIHIDSDSTTAIEGIHYESLKSEYTFKPNVQVDTLKVIVYRKDLSTSFTFPKKERLDLILDPSDDFDLGLSGGLKIKVLINNYLSQPVWWDSHMGLSYYHPQKWRILISFNDKYNNSSKCPFTVNNEGRGYITGLEAYLENVPTYDEETGARVKMYELVEKEDE